MSKKSGSGNKLRRLSDLSLSKTSETKVKNWLNEYVEHFKKLADGREGTVKRNDFANNDVFFWTDCTDLDDSLEKRINL